MKIQLVPVTQDLLHAIWKQGFSHPEPEWKKWDAPYFNDYQVFDNFAAFQMHEYGMFFKQDDVRGILLEGELIGMVSRYWRSQDTLWLEIGITIYNSNYWDGGIGTLALTKWITQTFEDFPELEHIGLTTWSGNQRMMKVAEKIGMIQEARYRKVRFYNHEFYDSLSYGILRNEYK